MTLHGLEMKYAALLLCAAICVNSANTGGYENRETDLNVGSWNYKDIKENSGAGNDNPSLAPSICAKKGSNGVLVAHEECNRYYVCDNGKPVARPCPKGLFFNPKKDQCDWLYKVDCGDRTIPGNNGEDEENEDGGSNNDDPSLAPSICAEKGSNGVLVAHEKCNRHYVCDNGKPVSRPCPKDLFFNPKKDQCDWFYKVDCGDRSIPGLNGEGDENEDCGSNNDDPNAALLLCAAICVNSANTGGYENRETDLNVGSWNYKDIKENSGAGNDNPSLAPSICAKKGSNGVLVAHEECNRYYVCDNGKPVARPCPKGLFFNPKKDQCDWLYKVDCGDRTIPGNNGEDEENEDGGSNNDDPSLAPSICAEKGSNGELVAHKECNRYYMCDNGKPVSRPCPKDLFFNPKKDQCDWLYKVDCGGRTIPRDNGEDEENENGGSNNNDPRLAPSICAEKGSNGVLVAHEKCNRYYVCDNGKPVARPCPKDLFFNPKKDQCDRLYKVDCGGRTIPRDNGEDEKNEDGGSNNDDPSLAPSICAEKGSNGILVAHEKCNRYYICDNAKPVARPCPKYLFFNPKKDQCDWSHNVNCSNRTIRGDDE